MNKSKPRCEYELIVEKYFGISLSDTPMKIDVDDHMLVDLVCAAHQHFTLHPPHTEAAKRPVPSDYTLEDYAKAMQDYCNYLEKQPHTDAWFEVEKILQKQIDRLEPHDEILLNTICEDLKTCVSLLKRPVRPVAALPDAVGLDKNDKK